MKKCNLAKEDPYLGLLNWRNTPTEGMSSCPAQRLLGRRTTTPLPVISKPTSLCASSTGNVLKEKAAKQSRMVERHEHHRTLKPLKVGDDVRVQPTTPHDNIWKPAKVTKVLSSRTYEVSRDDRTYRRNRRLLRHQPKQSSEPADSESDIPEAELSAAAPPEIPAPPATIASSDNQQQPYTTRYGRVVKPVDRYKP